MEDLILVRPDISMEEEISSYRTEFIDSGSSMDGCGSLRRHFNPEDWIAFNKILSSRETVPSNWVESTQFVFLRKSDKRIVGMIQVRHYFNEFLKNYGGNIGYSVRPSERRKGYAKRMLHDVMSYCRELGLDKVLVTCLKDNEGSRRTILDNGGQYECTVFEPNDREYLERYWVSTKDNK